MDAKVEKHLRAIVQECLGGPRGDPDESHLLAAAHAVVALQLMGFSVKADDEYFLSAENHLERDFLEEARTGG